MKKLFFILSVLLSFGLSFASVTNVRCYGDRGCGVQCSYYSNTCGGGSCSYLSYSFGDRITLNGNPNCVVTGVLGGFNGNTCGCDGYYCSGRYVDADCYTTSCEADSVLCVNSGNEWGALGTATTCDGKGCKTCDTTMNCVSYPFNRCVDVPAASEITCVNGQCSGLPGSMWWSEFRNECSNECGDVLTSSVMSDTAFVVGASCDDDVKCGSCE